MDKKPQGIGDVTAALMARMAAGRTAPQPGQAQAPRPVYRPKYDGICLKGWECPYCQGSGYYRLDVEPGHPQFGKLHRCPNVDITQLPGFERMGLHPMEVNYGWDKVREDIGVGPAAVAAAERVRDYIQGGSGWVYLYGSHGTAKSLIMKIAVAQALKAGTSAAYSNMASILNFMRAAYDSRNPNWEAEERLEWLAKLPLLAIDEFDLIQGTDWENNRRFQLMDERYNNAILGIGITIIASNRHPGQLPSWYADRVGDGRFLRISLTGQSARGDMEPGTIG